MNKMKRVVQIENWKLINFVSSPYMAPELGIPVLYGEVKDHPTLGEASIVTSKLISFNYTKGYAVTKNTFYSLGTPAQEWLTAIEEFGKKPEDYQFEEEKELPNAEQN